MAQEKKSTVEKNKELVFAFVETINEGNTEKLASMMSDEFKFTDIAGDIYIAKSLSERKKFWDDYINNFPDYKIQIKMMLSSGTDIAFIGKTMNSHLPRYIEVNETLIWYAEIKDNKISEWRIFTTEARAS